jgi:hypothetical protein
VDLTEGYRRISRAIGHLTAINSMNSFATPRRDYPRPTGPIANALIVERFFSRDCAAFFPDCAAFSRN